MSTGKLGGILSSALHCKCRRVFQTICADDEIREPCINTPGYPAHPGEAAVEANGFGTGLTIPAVLLETLSD